jgi:hypothetical protein
VRLIAQILVPPLGMSNMPVANSNGGHLDRGGLDSAQLAAPAKAAGGFDAIGLWTAVRTMGDCRS